MEIFVNPSSQVYIINEEGLRKPNIDEVEFERQDGNTIIFDRAITDQRINKCRCNSDEIILEKTNPKDKTTKEILKISTACDASHDLYKKIVQIGMKGKYPLEINKCEKIADMFYLDKMVETYMITFFKQ